MRVSSIFAGLLAVMTGPAMGAELITIKVGYSPGGSYDGMARLVADHLGDHLPGNPDIIVENAPGAGSLSLAKSIMQADASSSVTIATISSALALRPIFSPEKSDFNPSNVHYVASLSNGASYCIAHKNSGITSFRQFLDDPDAKVGSTGKSSTTYIYPAAVKKALDGKFQIVTGFKGGSEIDLAMERGDLQVRCGIGASSLSPEGLGGRVNIIAELSTTPRNEFQDIDFALDFVKDPAARGALSLVFSSGDVHHPYIVSANTSDIQVDELRAAFEALRTDPAFLADSKKRKLFPTVTGGEEVEALIRGFLNSSNDVQAAARALVE